MSKKVLICGAGPAGLFAAITAAENGASVTVLEKMQSPCRKLAITGKGRCNITNSSQKSDFIKKFRSSKNFIKKVFSAHFSDEVVSFFENNGVPVKTERGQRVFPQSDNAADVVSAIIKKAQSLNVKITNNIKVTKVITDRSQVVAIKTICSKTGKEETLETDNIIIATGGMSYPATGSNGDGYKIANSLGHTITQPSPALVPLETVTSRPSRCQGVSLRNINASLWCNGKKTMSEFGELLFTHFGLSGPVVLTLSREAVNAINRKDKVEISIDLKPALDHNKLDQRLLRDIEDNKKKQVENLLKNLLPSKMIPFCLDELNINGKKPAHEITKEERKKLRLWLKDLRFKIKNHRPLAEAIVTAGGIDTKEINPATMESRLIKGLFFAGETLDIDADTGGYNLQAAFSTGIIAGETAAK